MSKSHCWFALDVSAPALAPTPLPCLRPHLHLCSYPHRYPHLRLPSRLFPQPHLPIPPPAPNPNLIFTPIDISRRGQKRHEDLPKPLSPSGPIRGDHNNFHEHGTARGESSDRRRRNFAMGARMEGWGGKRKRKGRGRGKANSSCPEPSTNALSTPGTSTHDNCQSIPTPTSTPNSTREHYQDGGKGKGKGKGKGRYTVDQGASPTLPGDFAHPGGSTSLPAIPRHPLPGPSTIKTSQALPTTTTSQAAPTTTTTTDYLNGLFVDSPKEQGSSRSSPLLDTPTEASRDLSESQIQESSQIFQILQDPDEESNYLCNKCGITMHKKSVNDHHISGVCGGK
jgi:hypothetical protein